MKITTLGLDLGIGSVGWCLFEDDSYGNPAKIVDIGSFVYNQIEDGKTGKTENIIRRQKRNMRRQRRRKERRLEAGRALFQKYFSKDFSTILFDKEENPFVIKVKGLSEKLTTEELMIALYHYLKYRGFKSNRKVDDENTKDSDEKKMLAKYKETEQKLVADKSYISELIVKNIDEAKKNNQFIRIHNSPTEYNLTVTRDMYVKEINAILDKQISFGLINEDFKKEYLDLFNRQRDFSEGPGGDSPFKVDLSKQIGTCAFDGLPRAPKDSLTAKKFVLYSALSNLRYRLNVGESYIQLSPKEIKEVAEKAIKAPTLKYSQVFKTIGMDNMPYGVKGLSPTRRERSKWFKDFLKDNGITLSDSRHLSPEESERLDAYCTGKLFDKTFFRNSDLVYGLYSKIKKDPSLAAVITDDFFDEVADVLLKNKTDARISEACVNQFNFSEKETSIVKEMKNVDKTIDLSLSICHKLNPYLLDGLGYDEAMAKIGYTHSKAITGSLVIGKMPDIDQALAGIGITLKNPVVKHTLVQMRKVINSICDLYGNPTYYSVELARELKNSFKRRNEIRNDQRDNQSENVNIKLEMLEKYPSIFTSMSAIGRKKDAVLKYKLYKEQHGFSPYTNKPILESDLFTNDYQIDHILPYSRSFDDSFNNKVLVETQENFKKGNRTPYEYYHDLHTIESYLQSTYVARAKRENLLTKSFDNSDFLNKDFEDSSYIAVLAKKLIEGYMIKDGQHCKTVAGSMTDKLKKIWHLSGRTHSLVPGSSYESLYKVYTYEKFIFNDVKVVFEEGKKVPSIEFTFAYSDSQSLKTTFLVKGIKAQGDDKELSQWQVTINRNIALFADNIDYYRTKFIGGKADKNIDDLFADIVSTKDGSKEMNDSCHYVLGDVYKSILESVNSKDRSNDLHHALDAAVIACVTPAITKRLSDYYKHEENQNDFVPTEEKLPSSKVPLPYPSFDKEVLARVYERNEDRLIDILNTLPMYKDDQANNANCHVLYPTRLPVKDSNGPISGETIYGVGKNGELLTRKKVKDLKENDLKNFYEDDHGGNAVLEACREWIKNGRHGDYPILPKKGTPIKSVRLVVASSSEGRVDLSNNRFAENDKCLRVRVYKKNTGDDRLYFVPVFLYQIFKENRLRKGGKNEGQITYSIMWGQGDSSSYISKEELDSQYSLIASFGRYSLLEITKVDGSKGLCYSGGATSGMLEIYSIIGDDYDLAFSKLASLSDSGRYRLTVSTIRSIKVRNISCLGKIS